MQSLVSEWLKSTVCFVAEQSAKHLKMAEIAVTFVTAVTTQKDEPHKAAKLGGTPYEPLVTYEEGRKKPIPHFNRGKERKKDLRDNDQRTD
jgi:hypothetical protein